jgi:hypothetical protein
MEKATPRIMIAPEGRGCRRIPRMVAAKIPNMFHALGANPAGGGVIQTTATNRTGINADRILHEREDGFSLAISEPPWV